MSVANKNFETLEHGAYYLENNAWREPDRADPPQAIFTPPGGPLGWHWHWPGADNSTVMAFPEIIYGKKPFRSENTSQILPRQIHALKQISATYAVQTPASGAYNTVFEMWTTDSEAADQESITREIMIWVGNHGLIPAGKEIHAFDSPHGPARLFEKNGLYLAFLLEQEMLAGTLDLMVFINELLRMDLISGSDFLACVEFGNEVAFGQGVTLIDEYALDVA